MMAKKLGLTYLIRLYTVIKNSYNVDIFYLEGSMKDSKVVTEFLKDKKIDVFYCSPYKRSMDTISEAAILFDKDILTDACLRVRDKGLDGNSYGMFQRQNIFI